MGAKDRTGDKNWDVYEEEKVVGKCKCEKGHIIDVYTIASHEKVPRIERDKDRTILRCNNPGCPSIHDFEK